MTQAETHDIHPIAKWTVDPKRWQQFLALEDELAGSGKLENRIALSAAATEPVPVTVGWSEIVVGEDLHVIRPGTVKAVSLIQDAPRCLQIHIQVIGPDGDAQWYLRFPIPDASFVEVARVRNHFISDQYQRPRPTR